MELCSAAFSGLSDRTSRAMTKRDSEGDCLKETCMRSQKPAKNLSKNWNSPPKIRSLKTPTRGVWEVLSHAT